MRQYNLSLVFVFFCSVSYCQFGINIGYTSLSAPTWQIVADNFITSNHINIVNAGTTGGLDYTFPNQKGAFVFQPNIQFTKNQSTHINAANLDRYDFNLNNFSLQLNVNYYMVEFTSKTNHDNERMVARRQKKGVCLQFSPAIDHFRTVMIYPDRTDNGQFISNVKNSSVDFAYSLGAKIGVDFDWSPIFTLSPFVAYRLYSKVEWKDLTEIISRGTANASFDASELRQLTIGLRISFDLNP